MATYLVISNDTKTKSYKCKDVHTGDPYLKVSNGQYLDLTTNTTTGLRLEVIKNGKTYIPIQSTTMTSTRESWYETTSNIETEFNKYTIYQTFWYNSINYESNSVENSVGLITNLAYKSDNIYMFTYGRSSNSSVAGELDNHLTSSKSTSKYGYRYSYYYSYSSSYLSQSVTTKNTRSGTSSTQTATYNIDGFDNIFGISTYELQGECFTDYGALADPKWGQKFTGQSAKYSVTSSCESSYYKTYTYQGSSKVSAKHTNYEFYNIVSRSASIDNYSLTRIITTQTTNKNDDFKGGSFTSYTVYLLDSCTSSIFTNNTRSTTYIYGSETVVTTAKSIVNTTRSSEYTITIDD